VWRGGGGRAGQTAGSSGGEEPGGERGTGRSTQAAGRANGRRRATKGRRITVGRVTRGGGVPRLACAAEAVRVAHPCATTLAPMRRFPSLGLQPCSAECLHVLACPSIQHVRGPHCQATWLQRHSKRHDDGAADRPVRIRALTGMDAAAAAHVSAWPTAPAPPAVTIAVRRGCTPAATAPPVSSPLRQPTSLQRRPSPAWTRHRHRTAASTRSGSPPHAHRNHKSRLRAVRPLAAPRGAGWGCPR